MDFPPTVATTALSHYHSLVPLQKNYMSQYRRLRQLQLLSGGKLPMLLEAVRPQIVLKGHKSHHLVYNMLQMSLAVAAAPGPPSTSIQGESFDDEA